MTATHKIFLPGTAIPAHVLTGDIFSAGGNYAAAGTMPNNGQVIITPGAQQPIPQGYHDGTGYVAAAPAGEQWASGTATANSTGASFTAVGHVAANYDYITVTGLTFTPKRIVAINTSGTSSYAAATVYDADETTMTGQTGGNILCTSNSASDLCFPVSGNAYVNGTGFQIPVFQQGPYKWYAYQ